MNGPAYKHVVRARTPCCPAHYSPRDHGLQKRAACQRGKQTATPREARVRAAAAERAVGRKLCGRFLLRQAQTSNLPTSEWRFITELAGRTYLLVNIARGEYRSETRVMGLPGSLGIIDRSTACLPQIACRPQPLALSLRSPGSSFSSHRVCYPAR